MSVWTILYSVISLFPQVVMLALCGWYLSSKRTVDGFLLVFGSALSLVTGAFMLLMPQIDSALYMELMRDKFYWVTNGIGFIASISYAVGFGILIWRQIKSKE
jgi:hypothetical protein